MQMGRRERKRKRQPLKFRKKAVIAVLVSVAIFTVVMVVIYLKTGGVPDSLVNGFYLFAGGEAGFLGLIKYGESRPAKSGQDGPDGPAG